MPDEQKKTRASLRFFMWQLFKAEPFYDLHTISLWPTVESGLSFWSDTSFPLFEPCKKIYSLTLTTNRGGYWISSRGGGRDFFKVQNCVHNF